MVRLVSPAENVAQAIIRLFSTDAYNYRVHSAHAGSPIVITIEFLGSVGDGTGMIQVVVT